MSFASVFFLLLDGLLLLSQRLATVAAASDNNKGKLRSKRHRCTAADSSPEPVQMLNQHMGPVATQTKNDAFFGTHNQSQRRPSFGDLYQYYNRGGPRIESTFKV